MNYENTYRIFSLGDSAITIDFGNFIDEAVNKRVISLFYHLKEKRLEGVKELVPAYSSLTIYYDPVIIKKSSSLLSAYDFMKERLEEILKQDIAINPAESKQVRIPVCYDGDDLEFISKEKRIPVEDIIQIHSSVIYRVYMLGFLPGFPYMGQTDRKIAIPRKQQPRLKVEAGSVGIAGKQTGIYPLTSPGGWQIIGRTPMKLFEASPKPSPKERAFEDSFCLLHPGDSVQFYSISHYEFENY